jgi:hypothetical protein
MRLTSVLDFLMPNAPRARTGRRQRTTIRKEPAPSRLRLEALEDRCLPSFLAPVSYPAGLVPNDPRAVVTADFNGDGRKRRANRRSE